MSERELRPEKVNGRMTTKRVASLKPSPENEQIYDQNPEDIQEFAKKINAEGLLEPPVVTQDNFIVSGHRRHAALTLLGREFVKCRVLPVRRDSMSKDEYTALLRSHNRQREKSVAEKVREELVDINPEEAWDELNRRRLRSVNAPARNGADILKIEGAKKRHEISADKEDHMRLILQIVKERQPYWPLSVRGVHYPLLNFRFVRGYCWPHRDKPGHGKRQTLYYQNDDGSYDATSDLITRLRLNGTIPWEAFDDPTRPVKEFRPFANVREFVRQEGEKVLAGYWRDYLQSQPNHIECLVEKNTVYHMALQVTRKYQITTRSARGYNGIDSFHDIEQAYLASGKEKLIVIILSDHDPEGLRIRQVAGQTLIRDFRLPAEQVQIVQAGVTREQIRDYGLTPQNFAKEYSSNRDWYVQQNNGDDTVWELESLDPPDMLADLDCTVRSVLDIELFNRELAEERAEASYLQAARSRVMNALKGLAG